jgi:hypothetical protein
MTRAYVAIGCALALALGSAWCAQRVQAALGERALGLGRALDGWVQDAGADTLLELNGQRLHLTTQTSKDDVHALLDRFESACAQGALPLTAAPFSAGSRPHGLATLRRDFGDESAVAVCLARGEASGGLAELLQAFAAYARSGELAQFGLRTLFVRRTARGSHSLLAWSAGPLSLRTMFPERGDAGGADLPGLPRPEHARRVLSVQVQQRDYALAAYDVAVAPRAALAQYTRELAQHGFRAVPVTPQLGAEQALSALVRGPERIIVHGFRQDGRSVLAVVRMGERAAPRESAHVD